MLKISLKQWIKLNKMSGLAISWQLGAWQATFLVTICPSAGHGFYAQVVGDLAVNSFAIRLASSLHGKPARKFCQEK